MKTTEQISEEQMDEGQLLTHQIRTRLDSALQNTDLHVEREADYDFIVHVPRLEDRFVVAQVKWPSDGEHEIHVEVSQGEEFPLALKRDPLAEFRLRENHEVNRILVADLLKTFLQSLNNEPVKLEKK